MKLDSQCDATKKELAQKVNFLKFYGNRKLANYCEVRDLRFLGDDGQDLEKNLHFSITILYFQQVYHIVLNFFFRYLHI